MLEGREVVYLYHYYKAERNVCARLALLAEANLKMLNVNMDSILNIMEKERGLELSVLQKRAVEAAVSNGVCVITGGPGTGKTTIINAIMDGLTEGGLKVAIAAPTGRAAKRITETSGYFAQTIHRLLEYSFFEDSDYLVFGRNIENPLEYDAIIIDEASMIDLLLMNGLLNAITPGTRLILVGDADQLPSVGAGNILRDIIDSEYIYSVRLTEIFRQAGESMIVVNAHKINKGEYPEYNAQDGDFFLLRRENEDDMVETVKDLVARRLPAYYKDVLPEEIQVLTPTRRRTLGSVNLNKILQQVLNPKSPDKAEKTFGDRIFRENDKVMQIKNNYELEWKKLDDGTSGTGVFNGDIGRVFAVNAELGHIVVRFEGDRFVTYDYTDMDQLELAYAITVHKSQGSEFPVVVMPVSWFPPMLATRNLLYTAVTRGKQAVVLVGSEEKLRAMVDNNLITRRNSGLGVRLAMLRDFE
jgi:exodeoxyribonuclease V alpha subunit